MTPPKQSDRSGNRWLNPNVKLDQEEHPPHIGRGSVDQRRRQLGKPPLKEAIAAQQQEEATAFVEVAPLPVDIEKPATPSAQPSKPRRFRDLYAYSSKEELAAINDNLKQLNVGVPPEIIRWIDREILEQKDAGEEFTSRRAIVREALALFFEQKALHKDLG